MSEIVKDYANSARNDEVARVCANKTSQLHQRETVTLLKALTAYLT
jgi:hypothetical protein